MNAPVLEIENLHKTFRIGFWRKRVQAVRGVSFQVMPGEIFGLLGPNGAGKTTTIKSALRLIFPSKGSIRIFGLPHTDRHATEKVGYLPENPYVYQYLKPREFLDLCGRIMGMTAQKRRQRMEEMIERVGLAHAVDRPIGRFSKGMMQRIGLAQALLHDPEFLILDEPMSGLDPIGRKEVRDILFEQKARGKTLLFTSHILSDVERLCDRVAIIQRGQVSAYGRLDELLRSEVRRVEIELRHASPALEEELRKLGAQLATLYPERLEVIVEGDAIVPRVLEQALQHKAQVFSVIPKRETLEDLFVRNAIVNPDA